MMPRLCKYLSVLFAGLLLFSVPKGGAFFSWPPVQTPKAAYTVQQVAVTTRDGIALDGILYRPTSRQRPAALLLVHGYGGNFYSGYFPQLAQVAAEQGYASLALNMRDHDTGPKVSDFTDNEADIAAGVAYLHQLGSSRLVLLGQSMGTNRVLYYQATTSDPSIVATVLVSGPGNLFDWNAWQFGRKNAQATVDEALAIQAAGQEKQLMLVDLGPLGKALYTPRFLLSMRGPNAQSDPYRNIQKIADPVLLVRGTADKLVEPGIAERLRDAAKRSTRVDLIEVDGADHGFKKREGVLTQYILSWLEKVAP
jgi:pimeloyl-ACP methyl ester carboxylesterase